MYAESLWEEPQALDLLGIPLLDGNVGEAFFGDYMQQELRAQHNGEGQT